MKHLIPCIAGAVLVCFLATGHAAEAPTLTSEQKLRVQNAAQLVEIWTLRAQIAARETENARAALDALVRDVTPDGYSLTDKLELVPAKK